MTPHECDYKLFCEEIIELISEREKGILPEDEFMESLWEIVGEARILLDAEKESLE